MELISKVEKIKKAVNYLVTKHRESDGNPEDQSDVEKEKLSIKILNAKADKITEWQPTRGKKYYSPEDFSYDDTTGSLMCPAGHAMWLKCGNFQSNGGKHTGTSYMGHIKNCMPCEHRSKCIRKETTKARQVVILDPEAPGKTINYSAMMRNIFNTPAGRSIYSKRMGTVEPVFGNIAGTKKLDNFTLRGKRKVQRLLYCMVQLIGQVIAHRSTSRPDSCPPLRPGPLPR